MQPTPVMPHKYYYVLELGVLLGGFIALSYFSHNVWIQVFVLIGILCVYNILGLIHHKLHHDVRGVVVIEYALITILIIAAFLLLNVSRF